jgi:exopolyphosphatase/guanosine-5'-triphosphate,3'-diphosphate pyrophosphatase
MIQPQAVIEIGSTGVRLLVAELSEDNKRTILDRSDMPLALGRDVFTSGTISLDTQSQCLHILNRFAEQLAGWGITRQNTTVIATSAVREANNRDPFVDRIKIKTGFTVRVIDGIEENRLMYIAVRECLKGETKRVLQSNSVILEIAGGSTEIMLMEKGRMAGAHALRLGTVIIEQKRLSISVGCGERWLSEKVDFGSAFLAANSEQVLHKHLADPVRLNFGRLVEIVTRESYRTVSVILV